jgi:hypothetical protein
MQFFTNIKRSIYDPSFYEELDSKPLSFSLKYIFSFGLIFAVLIMAEFAIATLPDFRAALQKAAPFVLDSYPADLVLTLEDGELSTNMEEPYVVPGLDNLAMDMREGEEPPKHLIVIDTNVEPSAQHLEEYDTLILATKEYVLYQDGDGRVTTQSLKEASDVVLDKSVVQAFVAEYEPYLYLLIPLAFVGLFVFAFLYIMFHLVYLFIAALLIMLVAKVRNKQMLYSKAYQAGIHLLTLPLVFTWFSPVQFPFMFTLMLLVLAFINFEQKEKQGATS